jgi:protein TonB
MIRQLFASAGGVPEGRRTTGAAPFSVALHAAAIGGLLFFSSQKVASTDARPPIPVYQRPAATAVPAETPVVKVAIKQQPPRGDQRPAAPQKQAIPNVPTATPFVAPSNEPEGVRDEVLQPGPELAPYVPPGCANCTGSGPASVGNTGPETGPVATDNVIHIAEAEAPRKTRDVQPNYPEHLRRARVEGVVRVECMIAPDGHVREVRAVEGNMMFAPAALEAVRQWVFTPPKYNGKPVSVVMTVTIRFRIKY